MCFSSPKAPKPPAGAPDPALAPPIEQDIGDGRKAENRSRFGTDLPDLRRGSRTTKALARPRGAGGLRM